MDSDELTTIIDEMIDVRNNKKIECNEMKIQILENKKRPDIVMDTMGTKNVNQEDIAIAIGNINRFLMVADIQISLLGELRERINA